jgi:Family of unknown function (DUF5318)
LAPVSFRLDAVRGVTPGAAPGQIDYRLARKHVVDEFKRGRLSRQDVCDAHPELLRAARNLGDVTERDCPICEEAQVVLVSYVFGPRLPASGRCVSSRAELDRLSRSSRTLACYVVEVCPECSWNHLARSFPVGRARA